MTHLSPSEKALVPFVSVDHMMQLVHRVGLAEMIRRIAEAIEEGDEVAEELEAGIEDAVDGVEETTREPLEA